VRRAEVAGAVCVLLACAVVVFFLVGPVSTTQTASCSSDGPCVTSTGTSSLGWSDALVVPLVAAGLVLLGAALSRRTAFSLPVAGLGCLGLAVITLLGVFSIGLFLLPADAAAAVALRYIGQRRAAP
jgi:hypothetical protein